MTNRKVKSGTIDVKALLAEDGEFLRALACQCRLNFPHLCRSKIPQVRRSAISRPADRLSVILADVRGDAVRLVRLRA